jgi:alanyl-tRNA synthetase
MKQGVFAELVSPTIENYGEQYPELKDQEQLIKEVIQEEEARFRETLAKGLQEFEKLSGKGISGKEAFDLYQSYGFPFEVTLDLAREKGFAVDEKGFQEEFKRHQEVSRAGLEKKFRGGLADTKEETVRLHTANHLLLAALRQVLGNHVHQRGSNITSERIRLDFSHPQKATSEELQRVEELVNEKIQEGLGMIKREMPKEEAQKLGAEMEFGVKYGDIVSVYFAEDEKGNIFSKEFCGGPNVKNTKELGRFRIVKEEAVAAGVRRLRAVVE